MKKLFIVLVSLGLALGASAQHFGHRGGYFYGGPRIGLGFGFYSPFYPFGYYPYGYYPYAPYGYGYGYRPSRLTMQIEEIKDEYRGKIWTVKEDKSLTHKQKRQKIHQLKLQRDETIEQAKKDFYKNPSRPSAPAPSTPAPSAPPSQ